MKKVGVQLNDAHCAPERNGCFIEKARFQVESTFTLCLCYGWHTNVCYVCDNARTMTIVTSLLCSLSDVTYGCEAVHFRPSSFFVLLCGPQGIPTRLPNLNRNTNNYMLIEFGKVPPLCCFNCLVEWAPSWGGASSINVYCDTCIDAHDGPQGREGTMIYLFW